MSAPEITHRRRRVLSRRRVVALAICLAAVAALAVVVGVGGEDPAPGGPACEPVASRARACATPRRRRRIPEPESADGPSCRRQPGSRGRDRGDRRQPGGAFRRGGAARSARAGALLHGRGGRGVTVVGRDGAGGAGRPGRRAGPGRRRQRDLTLSVPLGRGPRLFRHAYDCSGSVSYALAAAGLVSRRSLRATDGLGRGRAGRWITVYATRATPTWWSAALRFDTSGRDGRRGSRWHLDAFRERIQARHFPGL